MSYYQGPFIAPPYDPSSSLKPGLRVFAKEQPSLTHDFQEFRTPAHLLCDIRICTVLQTSPLCPGRIQHLYSVTIVKVLQTDPGNVFRFREGCIADLDQEKWMLFEALPTAMEVDDEETIPTIMEDVLVSTTNIIVEGRPREESNDAFNCVICANTFADPCTLTCGHTYCRLCILQWMNTPNDLLCPTCRAPIQETNDSLSISVSIQKAIEWTVKTNLMPTP